MNRYAAFRNEWVGRRVDFDHVYSYQCVDLILQYLYENFQISGVAGNAIDYWTKTPAAILQKFDKVGGKSIQQGDILIHAPSAANGGAGHIQIADSGSQAMEQNGSTGNGSGTGGDAIRITNVNFNTLVGILRPKGGQDMAEVAQLQQQVKDLQAQIDIMRPDLVGSHNRIDGLLAEITAERSSYEARIAELTTKADALAKQVAEMPISGGLTADQAAQLGETNSIVKWIKDLLGKVFK